MVSGFLPPSRQADDLDSFKKKKKVLSLTACVAVFHFEPVGCVAFMFLRLLLEIFQDSVRWCITL